MPPDSKKRPAETPITPPPNKRASWASLISSSRAPLQTDYIPKKANKGPVLDLSVDPPTSSPESYCCFNAVKLFTEVKTPEEFRIAARVFWITYSAFQRGQTSRNRNRLLEYVYRQSGQTDGVWINSTSVYSQVWKSEHDAVVAVYESKFNEYVEKWMTSPAGRNYRVVVRKHRLRRVALPAPLKTADLSAWSYTANSKTPTQTFAGIEWTHRQIFDIFSILGEVTETLEITEPVGSAKANNADNGDKSEAHELDSWFVHDLSAIKKAPRELVPTSASQSMESWYSSLSAVASAVVLNLIHMDQEFKDVRGRKTYLKADSCRQLMLRIPTRGHPERSWPIDGEPLQAWMTYFADGHYSVEESPPTPPTDVIQADYQAFKAGETRQMTRNELDHHQREGDRTENDFQQQLTAKSTAAGIDPPTLHPSDLLDPSSYPAASKYPPEENDFVATFQSSNIYGQASMMDAKLSREIKRLQLLIENCKTRQTVLAKQKVDLMIKVKSIVKVEKMLDTTYQKVQSDQEEVEKLQLKVADAETDPDIKEFLDREVQIHRGTPNGVSLLVDNQE